MGRRLDLGFAREQVFDALQAHLAGLEGVERETQQGGRENQALHEEDQGHQVADAEAAAFQFSASQGKQQHQAHRRDALQERKQGAAGAGQVEGVVAVAAVALGKGLALGPFLAVDLDGADAGEVLLDQVAELGQGFLLTPLLAHHPAAEQADCHQHQWVEPQGRHRQPGVDAEHGRQGEGIGQGRVGEAEHGEAHQPPHVLHITGGPADHLAAAGALDPAGLLAEHVVEDLLLQIGFNLAAHAENQGA